MNARDIRRLMSLITVLLALAISLYRAEEAVLPSQMNDEYDSSSILLPEHGVQVLISRVVDGDTIKVLLEGEERTVRFIGLNAPESVDPRRADQCFGQEASAYMKTFAEGKLATLIPDTSQGEEDKYGRLLRYVEIEGEDVARRMIADGYALEYMYDSTYDRVTEYRAAEVEAQAGEKGLWAKNTCNGVL